MEKIESLEKLLFNWNTDERISWDEYFLSIALLISCRSPSPKLKVGSVIVKDNRVVAAGYNGFPSNTPHKSIIVNNHEINTIHSEQNAIAYAAKNGCCINNSIIYITHYPCINCSKMIISSGIKQIKYRNDYNNDPVVKDLLNASNIDIIKL